MDGEKKNIQSHYLIIMCNDFNFYQYASSNNNNKININAL